MSSLDIKTSLHDAYCTRAAMHHNLQNMFKAVLDAEHGLNLLVAPSILALIIKGDSIKYASDTERAQLSQHNFKHSELKIYQQVLDKDKGAAQFIGKGFFRSNGGSSWCHTHLHDLLTYHSQSFKLAQPSIIKTSLDSVHSTTNTSPNGVSPQKSAPILM